jgi:hypothetical protein
MFSLNAMTMASSRVRTTGAGAVSGLAIWAETGIVRIAARVKLTNLFILIILY